ncbi:MAG: carbohydrate-binding domain-containing protein [Clostridia bacterium]|nr:carbohydrate-binding domain-containing protein [Clostridia bacterium]
MKTIIRKCGALLLALTLLLGLLPLSVLAADYPTITLDEPMTFSLDGIDVTSATYAFTPPEDGTYRFYSYENDHDTFGYLLDGNETVLKEDDDSYGSGNNFLIVYEMTAGTTYLLRACFYTVEDAGSMTVKVEQIVPATGMTVTPAILTGYVGTETALYIDFAPDNAIVESVSWLSSDETVATVSDSGRLSFLKVGTTTVTATSENGLTATCEVTVKDMPTITRCNPVRVSLGELERIYFLFTPETDGTYAFYAYDAAKDEYGNNPDPTAWIWDADGNELAYNDDFDSLNFRVECALSAGTPYTLATENIPGNPADFSVKVVLLDEEGNEVHDVDGTYVADDDTTHSAYCNTCQETVRQKHSFDAANACTVCGLSHTHSIDYDYNDDFHWGYCSCGENVNEEHDLDETGACTKCDYFVHDCVVTEYSYDSTIHWGDCDLCGGYVEEEHILDENDACTKCDYYVHDCVVTDYDYDSVTHWGWCDICSEYIEEEHTLDEAGACTMCDYYVHECVVAADEAGYDILTHWGYCTVCGEYVETEHVFTDGICDCGMVEHEHQFTYDVYKDYHYVACSVCKPTAPLYEEHSFDENGACECGFFEHQCDEDGIDYDNTDHYTVCSQCGIHSVGMYESHTYEEGVCTVCGREQLQGVYIGDTLLTDMMYLSNDGTLSATRPEGGYACLVGSHLYLHNFVYVGDPDNSSDALYTEMDLAIAVSGMNTIHNTDGDGIEAAVGSLMIYSTDNGTLRVMADGDFDGIDVTNSAVLQIQDVNLYIESTDHGIEVDSPEGAVSIYNSNVFIRAGDDGIDTDAQLNVENTTLHINTEDNGVDVGYEVDATFLECNVYIYTRDNCGMDCGGDLSIDGGHYEMNTGEHGIQVENTVQITGGEFFFNARGNNDSILSYGDIDVDETVYGEVDIQNVEGMYPVLMADELVPLDSETVPLSQSDVNAADDLIYTGGTLAFPTVTVVVDGETLTKDVDYTLTWLAESVDGSGTYLAIVEGIGGYAGKKLIAVTVSEGEWVTGNGKTFFEVDGKTVKGLQKIGENYYYFNTGDGHLLTNKTIWIDSNNDYDLPAGNYALDEDGKLLLSGFVTAPSGNIYYRENNVLVTGVFEVDGKYYYFHHKSGVLQRNKTVWLKANNACGLPAGNYVIGEDGVLIVE